MYEKKKKTKNKATPKTTGTLNKNKISIIMLSVKSTYINIVYKYAMQKYIKLGKYRHLVGSLSIVTFVFRLYMVIGFIYMYRWYFRPYCESI